MKFLMQSKLLALGSNYQIKDEQGNLAFEVKGKFLSFGHHLAMNNSAGFEVARIEQQLMNFRPKYNLYLGSKHYATITHEFSWLNQRYLLDVPGPNDYEIEGNFGNYEYVFRRKSREVASVSKSFFSFPNSYGVEIVTDEDPVSILATAVVIVLCNSSNC